LGQETAPPVSALRTIGISVSGRPRDLPNLSGAGGT
jgi:hypothetical protein